MNAAPRPGADDGSLVAAIIAGDHASADALFRRYHSRLVQRMGRWTRDRAHAEDLAQEAWLKVCSALDRFDTQAPFWPWLRQIADNTARSDLRRGLAPDGSRRTVAVAHEVLERVAATTDEHRRVDDADALAGALRRIPARQRRAFLTVAGEGTSIPAAAAVFGLNENAFRQLYHRARHSLRARVEATLGTAPLLWAQRWIAGARDALSNPAAVSGLQGAAALGVVTALLVAGPQASTAAPATPAGDPVVQLSVPAERPSRGVPAPAPRRAEAGAAGTRGSAPVPPPRGATGGNDGSAKLTGPPEVGVAGIRVHGRRPVNPRTHMGVRPSAVGVPLEDAGYMSDQDPTTSERVACAAAKATPVTFCED